MIKSEYTGKADPRANKEVLGKTIRELLDTDPDVVYLDADLMSCINMKVNKDEAEPREIDCGIAEANMIGVACGLSAAGLKPIAHTFGPFASRRCFDQIFLSGGYAKNTVTVIGTDPGVCAAFNGGTHMPFEDMALYRAIPGAVVLDITDAAMLEDLLRQCAQLQGVKYIRVGRKSGPKVYADGSHFDIGRGVVLRDGNDVAIFACGIMVAKALAAAEELAQKGIDAAVIDLFTVKPLDEDLVLRYAEKCGAVVTAENHNRIGGLTSAVSDLLSRRRPTRVEHVAVEDSFGEVGPQKYLEERFGLTAQHIAAAAEQVLLEK